MGYLAVSLRGGRESSGPLTWRLFLLFLLKNLLSFVLHGEGGKYGAGSTLLLLLLAARVQLQASVRKASFSVLGPRA